jgi:hypothetical protein
VYVPLVVCVPDQPPEPVQELALVEDHVSVDVPPAATLVGLALRVTVGAGGVTETVADWAAEPPAPVHVNVYLAEAVSPDWVVEPLVGSLPLHAPEALQEVALVEDQVNVELPPLAIVLGFALRETVGAGVVTVTVAD